VFHPWPKTFGFHFPIPSTSYSLWSARLSTRPSATTRTAADVPSATGVRMSRDPAVPPHTFTLFLAVADSVAIRRRLENFGIPGIKGVWSHYTGSGGLFNVISIDQMFSGHAKKVGVIASQYPAEQGGYTVVVEDDIDPSNLDQVLWAMVTRCRFDRQIVVPNPDLIGREKILKVHVRKVPLGRHAESGALGQDAPALDQPPAPKASSSEESAPLAPPASSSAKSKLPRAGGLSADEF